MCELSTEETPHFRVLYILLGSSGSLSVNGDLLRERVVARSLDRERNPSKCI